MADTLSDKNTEQKTLTARQKKIQQLRKKLERLSQRESAEKRAERNGTLIAFGIAVEAALKTDDTETKNVLIGIINKHLKERNLNRAMDGVARIESAQNR